MVTKNIMRTRSLLFLLIPLAFVIAGCGGETSTLTEGDSDTEVVEADAVADDSSPVTLAPTTTQPWDETLADYPLLTILDDDRRDGSVGSASFVLVDADGTPLPSGSDDFPAFIVEIDGWYGAVNYIEHTISANNAKLRDGKVRSVQCGGSFAHLRKTGDNEYVRNLDQLPAIRGTILSWDAAACEENLPVNFDDLFDGPIQIQITDAGFELNAPVADLSAPILFRKLAPEIEAQVPQTTTIAPETTDVPQSTTTTTEPE